jgi:hypothetical protein
VVGQPSGSQIAADTGMTIDTSLATYAGHQPSGGRSFRKQRTVNPLTVPARYNLSLLFLKAAFASAAPRRRNRSDPDEPAMQTISYLPLKKGRL